MDFWSFKGGGLEIHVKSGTCRFFLRTCLLYFKQVLGLTVYQKNCSGLLFTLK